MSDALTVAVEAARAAGRIQKERAGNIGDVHYKGEINLVTEVDLLCEQEIIGRIRKAFPTHAFLAEESGVTEGDTDHVWIIDPLDGTVNYAHGYPAYCTSIAYQHKGEVVAGAVYNPCLDELFAAEKGQGATLNGNPISVSPETDLKKSLLATGFPYDINDSPDNNFEYFMRFMTASQTVRRPGSAAMDLCYTAMGRFEGFWEMKLHPWDYAAGWLLVEEAGGKVTRFDGSPFQINDRSILASNGPIHQAMVELLK